MTHSLRHEVIPAFCTRTAQAAVLMLLALLLLNATGCTTQSRYEPTGEQLGTPEVEGTNVYVGYSNAASGVVVVVDGRVFLVRPGEDQSEPEVYVENDEPVSAQARWVPFLIDGEQGYRVWYYAAEATHPLLAYERAPGSETVLKGQEVADSFRSVTQEGQPLTPIMFPEQYYRFQYGGDWYELTVKATSAGEESFRYALEVAPLAEEPEAIVGAPGFDVVDLGDHRTMWLFRDWGTSESIGEWVNTSVAELGRFFDIDTQLLPLHIIIGPPGLYAARIGGFGGYTIPEYSAITSRTYYPNAKCVEDPDSSVLCNLVRHELTHVVQHWALLQEGYSFFDASRWFAEGLATFWASSYDDQAYARNLAALAATDHVTPFDPEDVDGLVNPQNLNYTVATTMVGYLMDQFDPEVVAEYATRPTFERTTEDQLMQQYFALNRSELFEAVLNSYRAPSGPSPDYAVANWELLGGPELVNSGFTLNPEGTEAAVLYNQGTELRLLDLETGKLRTILSKPPIDLGLMGPVGWFPDGQRIVFGARPQGVANIYSMDIDDPASVEPLVKSDAVDSGPAVAPGGKQLAFRSERTGHSELYLLDLDTGETEQLTTEESHLAWPTWAPDGSRLALVDETRNRLGVLDLATRGIEWLSLDPYGTFTASRPRWLSNRSVILNVSDPEYRVLALSFDTEEHTRSTWGAADTWPSFDYFDLIPGSSPPRFLAMVSVYGGGRIYQGLVQVEFEEGGK